MPFYQAMFRDAGHPDALDGVVSDGLADELVLVGTEERVSDGLDASRTRAATRSS